MLTTQPNKEFYLQHVSLFGCVVSICSACCKIDKVVFLICRCFFSICSALSSPGHRTEENSLKHITNLTVQKLLTGSVDVSLHLVVLDKTKTSGLGVTPNSRRFDASIGGA